MRLIISLYLLFSFLFLNVHGQNIFVGNELNSLNGSKPLVDSSCYSKWPYVADPIISSSGNYTYYSTKNVYNDGCNAVLKECTGDWEMRIPDSGNFQFSANGKVGTFMSRDSLYVIELGKTYSDTIAGVQYFKLPSHENSNWLAYKNSQELVLYNLISKEKRSHKSVKNFLFTDDGKSLILETEGMEKDESIQFVDKLTLATGKTTRIWKGRGLEKMLFNNSASIFVFLLSNIDMKEKAIWYKSEVGEPVLLVNNAIASRDSILQLDDIIKLSDDGARVFFTTKGIRSRITKKSSSSTLTVWSYMDEKLQSAQSKDDEVIPVYTSVIEVPSRHITNLDKENDWILSRSNEDNVCLIQHMMGTADAFERAWNPAAFQTYFIKSLRNDDRLILNLKDAQIIQLSPAGKFVVYYDKLQGNYFSYEIATGVYRNISSGIEVSWIDSFRDDLILKTPRGIGGWLKNDVGVLIYDRFDIWLIDPLGMSAPLNITNGYGLRNNIIFNLGLQEYSQSSISKRDTLILNALNLRNMQNGFFKKVMNKSGNPVMLTMDDCIYHLINNPYVDNAGMYPIKASNSKKYIVLRMKSNESPNYFFTSDFTKFVPITNIHPERAFNWYRTELHSWRKEGGRPLNGVLYKPENFNPNKKYPVIFRYYEKRSFALNEYLVPEFLTNKCNLNIPTFVSNGYLVFAPDIEYEIGDPMQGTYDAVVSAAQYLSSLPFIDKSKMGIGGCSFGGLQTNYLITHTNLFAAAYSSSSMCDFISAYGDVPSKYQGLIDYFESGQARMGGTLWQIPDKYIKNSPIFGADKVTTPLLLMHTTNDGVYSFSQALEFFTGLRRLGKRVWLLEYSDGNHAIYGKSAEDFSIRLNQFFDHYLKGTAAPIWMTRGIPVQLKGVENGYNLDYDISTPGKGLVGDSASK
ncbi:prolyl oligopeptidase family serine peptidase [Chitinophaga sp. CC14]|uniref:alpha/beta hydrolase family protein n=1 Tax=Chitinophaga sp. CC14 TaxID=3029199 RepID=UPI003B80A1DD